MALLASLALLLPLAAAQFSYPPPLTAPLTTALAPSSSPLNFSAGDSLFGAWYTPPPYKSYLLYRCAQTSTSSAPIPILPSNDSVSSPVGEVSPSDKTWSYMPNYVDALDSAFGNGNNPGDTPIWFYADFPETNSTTGDMCWFELYPGSERVVNIPPPKDVGGDYEVLYNVTLDGSGKEFYFATMPFWVRPRRPDGLTVTWKVGRSDTTGRGMPTPDLFRNDSGDAQRIIDEFGLKSGGKGGKDKENGARGMGIGVVLGLLMGMVAL